MRHLFPSSSRLTSSFLVKIPNHSFYNHTLFDPFRTIMIKPTETLSDGSRASPSPTYRHKWTVEQRLTLTMLHESYKNNWKEITSVFNHIHKSDLRRCGGLRTAVVQTQCHDMRKKFDAAAALRRLQDTLSPNERSKLVSQPKLEKKAKEIGIQLNVMRPTNTLMFDKHNASGRNRKRADRIDDRRTDFLPYQSDDESQRAPQTHIEHTLTILPKTPTKSNGKHQYNGPLTPPDSRERKIQRLTADKRLAQIGFRAFTPQSQGTYCSVLGIRGKSLTICCSKAFYLSFYELTYPAGAFLNCPTVPLARDLDVTTYRREAL